MSAPANKMIIVTTNNKTGETTTREVDVTPPPIEESTTTNRRTGETVVRRRGDIMTTPQTQTVYEQYQAGQIGAEDVKSYVDSQLENYGLSPKILITEAPEGYFYTAEGEGGYKTYNRQIRDFNKQVGAYRKKVLGVLLAREPGEVIEWTVEGGGEAMPFVGPPAPSEAERAEAIKRHEAGLPSMGLPGPGAGPKEGTITDRLHEAAMWTIDAGENFMQRVFGEIREPGAQLRAQSLQLSREGEPGLGLAAYLGGAGIEFGATVLETVSLLGRPKALGKALAMPGLLIVDEDYRSAMVDSLLKDPFLFVGNVATTAATPWLLGKTAKLLKETPILSGPRGAIKFMQTPGVTVDITGKMVWPETTKASSILGKARATTKFLSLPRATYPKEPPVTSVFSNRDISGLLQIKAKEAAEMNAAKVEAFMTQTFREPAIMVKSAPSTSAVQLIRMAEKAAQRSGVDVFPFTVISYPPESRVKVVDVDRLLTVQLPKASVMLKQRLTESTALDQVLRQTQPQRLKQLQPLKLVPVTEFNIKEVGIPKFDVKITQILTPIADQILKQTQTQKQRQFAPTIMEQVTRQNTATRRLMKKLEPKPTGKKRKGRRVGVYELRVDFTPPNINLDKMIPKVNLKGLKL